MSEPRLTTADVAHLRPGMPAVLKFKGGMTIHCESLYEDACGTIFTSMPGILVRFHDGDPASHLVEVVEPKPPAPAPTWPVGTRLTDGAACAIKTADGSHWPWIIYGQAGTYDTGEWLKDDEVAGWTQVEDHLPAVTRPALPDGHVAVDMRDIDTDSLQGITRIGSAPGCGIHALIAGRAAAAELARREGGEQS